MSSPSISMPYRCLIPRLPMIVSRGDRCSKVQRLSLFPQRKAVYAYGCIEELLCVDLPRGVIGQIGQGNEA